LTNKILFVDDDAKILAALKRRLRKKFSIETVEGGREGLNLIQNEGPYSVIISDFCMPIMNGIEFLSRVREIAPDTVRMMLTGSADLQAAIQAVNEGNIFRFLSKPCSVETLTAELNNGIEQYRLTVKEKEYNQKTRHSLAQAMEVQRDLMPKSMPTIDGLDIAGDSVSCDETGGDYYDFFNKTGGINGRIGVVVGDVSDHGVPSALLMASARAFMRERVLMPGSVGHIISGVNRQLTNDVQTSGRFMTLFYAEIDLDERSIRWVRAGHDPAILYDVNTDSFEELGGRGGLPLGVYEDSEYEEYHRALSPGQIIFIGTDGTWEACNKDGKMFGKEALRDIIRDNAMRPAKEIIDRVMTDLNEFLYPLKNQDDATLVLLKMEG